MFFISMQVKKPIINNILIITIVALSFGINIYYLEYTDFGFDTAKYIIEFDDVIYNPHITQTAEDT